MRKIVFEGSALNEMLELSRDKIAYKKIEKIFHDIQKDPKTGVGNPEPLKYDLSGLWSRRITDKDRMIYYFSDENSEENNIVIVSMKSHYGDK